MNCDSYGLRLKLVSEAELITICLDAADRADVTLVAMSSNEQEFDVLLACEHGCQVMGLVGWGGVSVETLSYVIRRSFTNWEDAERCIHE